MTCKPCSIAKTYPQHRMHCPSCIYCGARLIQNLGRLQIQASECTARRRAALAVWVQHGHDEAEIRALVKGPLCTGPAEATASVSHSSAKQPSRGPK